MEFLIALSERKRSSNMIKVRWKMAQKNVKLQQKEAPTNICHSIQQNIESVSNYLERVNLSSILFFFSYDHEIKSRRARRVSINYVQCK